MGLIVLQLMVRLVLRLNDTAHTPQIFGQGEMIEFMNYCKRQAFCFPTKRWNCSTDYDSLTKTFP